MCARAYVRTYPFDLCVPLRVCRGRDVERHVLHRAALPAAWPVGDLVRPAVRRAVLGVLRVARVAPRVRVRRLAVELPGAVRVRVYSCVCVTLRSHVACAPVAHGEIHY